MITARSGAVAAGYQGMLIITGGVDDKNKKLSSTELFDSSNGQWYVCNDLPQPHSCLQSVILDNILYLLGGENEGGRSPAVFTAPLGNLSRRQLKWSTIQDTPWCRSAPLSVNGRDLLIIGGRQDAYRRISHIYMLNKVTHSWEAIGHIPFPRDSAAVVSTANDKVVVIGGRKNNGEATNTVWVGSYEPQ